MAAIRCEFASANEFGGGNSRYLMRLQFGQHLGAEATDLFQEQCIRHRPEIEVEQERVCSCVFGGLDNKFGHLFRGAPGELAGLHALLNIGQVDLADLGAVELGKSSILGPNVLM